MLSDLRTDSTWPAHAAPLLRYGGSRPSACADDAQLCIEVRLALLRTCPTLACSVEISAQDGVVHLRGSVGSERMLVRMYKTARTVPGIHWICNDVTVARPA
jgi:osmotically-inducible protein OsmY